jgi:hypothetical protein
VPSTEPSTAPTLQPSKTPTGSQTDAPSSETTISASPTFEAVSLGDDPGDESRDNAPNSLLLALAFGGYGIGMIFGLILIMFSLYRSYYPLPKR